MLNSCLGVRSGWPGWWSPPWQGGGWRRGGRPGWWPSPPPSPSSAARRTASRETAASRWSSACRSWARPAGVPLAASCSGSVELGNILVFPPVSPRTALVARLLTFYRHSPSLPAEYSEPRSVRPFGLHCAIHPHRYPTYLIYLPAQRSLRSCRCYGHGEGHCNS